MDGRLADRVDLERDPVGLRILVARNTGDVAAGIGDRLLATEGPHLPLRIVDMALSIRARNRRDVGHASQDRDEIRGRPRHDLVLDRAHPEVAVEAVLAAGVIQDAAVGDRSIPGIARSPLHLQAQVVVLVRVHRRDAAADHARDADDRAAVHLGHGEHLVGILVETDHRAGHLLALRVHPRPEIGVPAGQVLAVEELGPLLRLEGGRFFLGGVRGVAQRKTRHDQSSGDDVERQSHGGSAPLEKACG